jgi:molybdopterin converting factor small subunit
VPVVHLSSTLARHTGGVEQITIDAPRVKELVAELLRMFPGLELELDQLAVAIDGDVRPDAEYEPLLPNSQVYFVPRIAGGDSGRAGMPT